MPDTVKRHVFKPVRHAFDGAPATVIELCAECHASREAEQHLKAIELTDVGQAWLAELRTVADAIKATEALLEPLGERRAVAVRNLQAEMGDAEAATIGGRPVLTWAWSKPGDGIDLERLKREWPDVYAQLYKPNKAARPFKPLGDPQ